MGSESMMGAAEPQLSGEVKSVLQEAMETAKRYCHQYCSETHLVYAILLKIQNDSEKIPSRIKYQSNRLRYQLEEELRSLPVGSEQMPQMSESAVVLVADAIEDARESKNDEVNISNLVRVILKLDDRSSLCPLRIFILENEYTAEPFLSSIKNRSHEWDEIMIQAKLETKAFGTTTITPGILFLSLVELKHPSVAVPLERSEDDLGVLAKRIRGRIQSFHEKLDESSLMNVGELKLSPEAHTAIQEAERIAHLMGAPKLRGEHLLEALIVHHSAFLKPILQKLGLE